MKIRTQAMDYVGHTNKWIPISIKFKNEESRPKECRRVEELRIKDGRIVTFDQLPSKLGLAIRFST